MGSAERGGVKGGRPGYLVKGALSLFIICSFLWKIVYWTHALMLIGACVLPELADRKPCS